jgi:lipoprotein-anchoring transpeptidase ErfK/SrfK
MSHRLTIDRLPTETAQTEAGGAFGRVAPVVHLLWNVPLRVAVVLLVVTLAATPADAMAAPQVDRYVVQQGDTLANIAARMGVSIWALAEVNGIQNADLIYVGQALALPSESTPVAPETAPTAAPAGSVYVVRQGDTLSSIAAHHGTSAAALMSANDISNADRIHEGQLLFIKSSTSESSGTSSERSAAPTGSRWIDIDLSGQRLTAYQGNTAVFSALVSTGIAGWRTPVGEFAVRTKVRAQTMSGPGYNLPNVQYVMYFAGENAIHGTYWHKNFGHPMSHGCVNLPTAEAGWLYKWASIGTPVVTHY